MSTATPAVTGPSMTSSRGARHYYRSRRGPRQVEADQATSSEQPEMSNTRPTLLPASVTPADGQEARTHNARGRGARRGGSARRGGGSQTVTSGNRVFGGQLTNPGSSSLSPLHPGAPEFRPGQASHERNNTSNHLPIRSRRTSKSSAPDLATRIHEDIAYGLYECPICTVEVQHNSKIWSCKTCWTVFHLACIKRWSKNEGSTQQQDQGHDGEIPPARQWRCPGCNLPKDDLPTSYTCWCSKEVDPKPIAGLMPHSCGQTCGKSRAPRRCPHPCELPCHAGPCPSCPHAGPVQACFCGKESLAKRCVETDYDNGWSCGKVCGDLMPCCEHACGRGCHEGLCGGCEVSVESRCYCGRTEKKIPCCERGEPKESTQSSEGKVNSWIGSFECDHICKRPFDCEKHTCEKPCHAQDVPAPHCPLSIDVVSHCPCGKTTLEELGCRRLSCDDAIPHCLQTCQRPLQCGHQCQQKCHSGDCRPCLETFSINCRCGRTTSTTICHQGTEEPPQCSRNCKALLNCGRHECGERCCPGEKLASKRKAKASRTVGEDIEAEHICTRTCGRQLKCGNIEHECQELCHRGPCGSCREATFDEVSCHCGHTVLHPPLACGTQPPNCLRQCDRPRECGHPQILHQCHIEDECPKCPYLVQKVCMCGKSNVRNQQCGSVNIGCGQICGRRLRCGIHFCKKPCHRPGDCEDAGTACPHRCGQKKTAPGCGHQCPEPCHAPYPCKEDKACQAKVIITCECQNKKQELRCLATKSNEGSERRSLQCDDECLRLQRNQKLALALNISADHMDDHCPYSSTTLDMFKDNLKWCQTQEREFRVFAADESTKRLRFKPMPPHQRAFIHSIAEDFGLDSESMDPEPHRHVSIFKTPRFVSAPMKTLSQCLKIQPRSQPSKSTIQPVEPFNALILSSASFALTIDELRSHLRADLATAPMLSFNMSFLPSEEIVLYPGMGHITEGAESTLKRLKPVVAKTLADQSLAKKVALCRVDASLNVIRREREDEASSGGWSQVVKGGPISTREVGVGMGSKSSFAVLGSKVGEEKERLREKKKREKELEMQREKEKEDVVDDWETALENWADEV